MISYVELKSKLDYNPETGIFIWIDGNSRRMGKVAGTVNKGYICIRLFGKQYRAHRLAWLYMTRKFPDKDIDHINRIKMDNRWCNLREATIANNAMNQGMLPSNTSGYKGVSWCKKSKKWQVKCAANGKQYYLGRFKDKEVAYEKYKRFAKLMHGEFYAME